MHVFIIVTMWLLCQNCSELFTLDVRTRKAALVSIKRISIVMKEGALNPLPKGLRFSYFCRFNYFPFVSGRVLPHIHSSVLFCRACDKLSAAIVVDQHSFKVSMKRL